MHPSIRRQIPLLLILVTMICGGSGSAAEKKSPAPALRVHPLVFSMVQGWLSDGESPVVTEINLDAVAVSRNQFASDAIKEEDGWLRCPDTGGSGFLRYRVLKSEGTHYTVEYQENGGGSLTTAAIIAVVVEKRQIEVDGKPVAVRVLRVISYRTKGS